MTFTRRQWLGASAAGILGAVTAGMKLSPLAQAMAATELSPAAQLAALKAFSGKVAHATHYGPLIATVQKGRIVRIEAQASDKRPTAMLTEGVLDPECFYINQWVRRYFLLDGYLTGVLRTQGRVR